MLNKQLHDELAAFLRENYHEFDEETKCFFDEAYTDYEDRVSDKELGKVLDSDDPEQALEEMLWDCYTGCEWQYRDDIVSNFLKTPEGSKYNYDEVDNEFQLYTDEQIKETAKAILDWALQARENNICSNDKRVFGKLITESEWKSKQKEVK